LIASLHNASYLKESVGAVDRKRSQGENCVRGSGPATRYGTTSSLRLLTLHFNTLIRLNSPAVGAHTVLLWRRRLHLERDRLRVAVGDCESSLDELSQRTCRVDDVVHSVKTVSLTYYERAARYQKAASGL
jgi:hypothetical protein